MIRSYLQLPSHLDDTEAFNAKVVRLSALITLCIGFLVPIFLEISDYFNQENLGSIVDVIAGVIISFTSIAILFLIKQGRIQQAAIVFVSLGFLIITMLGLLTGGVKDSTIALYFFLIVLSGLILGKQIPLILAVAATSAMFLFYLTEINGWLSYPTERIVSIGEWFDIPLAFFLVAIILRFFVESADKRDAQIRESNKELQEVNQSLEGLIQDRTQALQQTIEIGRQISSILDSDQLVLEIVEIIKHHFGYYHVHVYLVDEAKRWLVMVGGSGEVGKAMVAQKHKLSFGLGIVGRVAREKTAVLISNVEQDESWLPNPLLKETAAELAVPILLGDELLGVLDVQNNKIDSLSQADISILQAITNQIAVALRNARIISQIRTQAQQETIINDINHKIQAANDIESVFEVVATELNNVLNINETKIRLGNIQNDQ